MKTIVIGTLVEWDDKKDQINQKKHGISFETAALVFADRNRVEYYDKLHSATEDRYIVIVAFKVFYLLYIQCVEILPG